MAPWIGDEDDWWNYSLERETEQNWDGEGEPPEVLSGPGPLALFGPSSVSSAGALLGSVGTKVRAIGAVGTDLATGTGPTSGGIEAGTGIETDEVISDGFELSSEFAERGLDGIRDVADNPPSPDDVLPGWLRALLDRPKLLTTVLAGGVALYLLGPLLGIVENATEG